MDTMINNASRTSSATTHSACRRFQGERQVGSGPASVGSGTSRPGHALPSWRRFVVHLGDSTRQGHIHLDRLISARCGAKRSSVLRLWLKSVLASFWIWVISNVLYWVTIFSIKNDALGPGPSSLGVLAGLPYTTIV